MTSKKERKTAEQLHDLMRQARDILLKAADGDPLRAIGLLHVLPKGTRSRTGPTYTSHQGATMSNQSKQKLDPSKYISAADLVNLPPKPTLPFTGSPWDFNEEALTLELYEPLPDGGRRFIYEVDLERCTTPAQVLDWIIDNTREVWEDDTRLASLVRDLFLYLGPKACFGPRTPNVIAEVRKRMARANILRGKRPRGRSSRRHEPRSAAAA